MPLPLFHEEHYSFAHISHSFSHIHKSKLISIYSCTFHNHTHVRNFKLDQLHSQLETIIHNFTHQETSSTGLSYSIHVTDLKKTILSFITKLLTHIPTIIAAINFHISKHLRQLEPRRITLLRLACPLSKICVQIVYEEMPDFCKSACFLAVTQKRRRLYQVRTPEATRL